MMTALPERNSDTPAETRRTLDEMAHWRERLDQALSALRQETDRVQRDILNGRDESS